MSTVIVIAGKKPVNVISEKIIEDGRQRLDNGVDRIEPEKSAEFVVNTTQSLRIVELDDSNT